MVLPRKRPTNKKEAAPAKRTRRTKAQMGEARGKPEVKENTSIIDILGDEVTITIGCEVKSSVEYQSVGCHASLTTNVPKNKLAESEDKMRDYLRNRVLEEHRRLDVARRNGFEE